VETLADTLTEAFARAWLHPHAAGPGPEPPPPEAATALRDLVAAGQAAWPELPVDGAALAAHVGSQMTSDARGVVGALRAIGAADLHLAFACGAGVPGALAAFDRACAVAIEATIARIDRSPTFRDEVRQALHQRLFVGGDGDPPRILSYTGRGPLLAWAAIVTRRVALSLRRGEANRARIEDRAMTEALDAGGDPELDYLKRRYQGAFKAAFRAAL